MKNKGISRENIKSILSDLEERIDENKDETSYSRKTGREISVGYGTSCFSVSSNDKNKIEF